MKLYQMMLMEFFFFAGSSYITYFPHDTTFGCSPLQVCFSVQTKGDKSNSLLLQRNVFIFTQECINLPRNSLRIKMYLNSAPFLKGVFFVLKDFDRSSELQTVKKKSLQFHMFLT